jgi:DNA-binding HxlR family transcriptional regulator
MKTRTIKLSWNRDNELRKFAQVLGARERMEILLAIDAKGRIGIKEILDWYEEKGLGRNRTTLLERLNEMVEKDILIRENGTHGSKGWYTINVLSKENKPFFTIMYGSSPLYIAEKIFEQSKIKEEEE